MTLIKDHILVLNKRPNTRTYHSTHPTRSARRQPQWTLHREGCFYIQRATTATKVPAPLKPYPNTVPCTACKPDTTKAETP
jgi:hypothetical protein